MATGSPQVHDRKSTKLVCELCDSEVDTCVFKCVDCGVYMCSICTKAHQRVKQTSEHKILSNQHGPLPSSRANTMCTIHLGEDVNFYCHACVTFICSLCITKDHRSHECSLIRIASKEMATNLSKKLSDFKDSQITALVLKIRETKALLNENKIQGDQNVQSIKKHTKKLVEEVTKIQDKLLMESEKITQQNEQQLKKICQSQEDKMAEMEGLYDEYNKVLTSGSDIDKIVVYNEAATLLDEHKSHDQEVKVKISKFIPSGTNIAVGSLKPVGDTKGYVPDSQSLTNTSNKEITSVSESKTTLAYKDTSPFKSTDIKSLTPTDISIKKGILSPVSSNRGPSLSSDPCTKVRSSEFPIINVDIIRTFKFKSDTVRSICPVSDNNVFMHSLYDYSIDRVDSSGYIQGTEKLDFKVCDFVVTTDNSMIVTDFDKTNIYKFTIEEKLQLLYAGPLYPLCLCLTSDGHILVTMIDGRSYNVNAHSKRLVTRMATTGQTLAKYDYINGKRLFDFPSGIDENINGDICVVNREADDAGNVIILRNDGARLLFTYRGQTHERFDPKRVKCDTLGHIIVTDFRNKRIHMLNNEGQLIQYLMTNKELSNEPFSVAIDTKGLLWVGCGFGHVYVVKYVKKGKPEETHTYATHVVPSLPL